MRWTFQRLRRTIQFQLNDSLLREADIGIDGDNLYFPAVSTCTCLVLLLDNNTLAGIHLDKGLSRDDVIYLMAELGNRMPQGRAVVAMAVLGNLAYISQTEPNCFMTHVAFANGAQLNTFAQAFNFAGQVRSFDQGLLANLHYRAQAPGGGNLLLYSAAVKNVNGFPQNLDRQVGWQQQLVA